MFRKMPFILLAQMALIALIHPWIPLPCKSFLYGLSLSIKSGIVFFLPAIIFGLLFKTAVQLSKQASKTILFILIAICLSNFCSTMISYLVGKVAYQFDLSMVLPKEGLGLVPSWTLELPKWIGNGTAMLSGLLLGVLLGIFRPVLAATISSHVEKAIGIALRGLLFVIPIFIVGFLIQMNHDQIMGHIVQNYGLILSLITCAVFSYILSIYFMMTNIQGTSFIESLKNMMPAAIAGFGSMSSAAAMPLTLLGAEKNSDNPDIAKSVIPATVNIHLIGDCFAIPIFAFAVLKSFGAIEPTFLSYLSFASFFVLAKFSVAAVPGGGILVMLPILEAYLGFTPTMLSLITSLYILFDPVITCANVLGNGAFSMVLGKVLGRGKRQEFV